MLCWPVAYRVHRLGHGADTHDTPQKAEQLLDRAGVLSPPSLRQILTRSEHDATASSAKGLRQLVLGTLVCGSASADHDHDTFWGLSATLLAQSAGRTNWAPAVAAQVLTAAPAMVPVAGGCPVQQLKLVLGSMQGCTAAESEADPLAASLLCFTLAQIYERALVEAESTGSSLEGIRTARDCESCQISRATRDALGIAMRCTRHCQLDILEMSPEALRAVQAVLSAIASWALSDHLPMEDFRLRPHLPASFSGVLSITNMEEVSPASLWNAALGSLAC